MDLFKDVRLEDGQLSGTILGVNEVLLYKSCSNINCQSSLKNLEIGDNCKNCTQKIEEVREDFRFFIVVQSESDVKTYLCFKSQIEIVGKVTYEATAIETFLNENLSSKQINFTYTKKNNVKTGEEEFVITALTFG